jgi:hypothetical protein
MSTFQAIFFNSRLDKDKLKDYAQLDQRYEVCDVINKSFKNLGLGQFFYWSIGRQFLFVIFLLGCQVNPRHIGLHGGLVGHEIDIGGRHQGWSEATSGGRNP